MQGVFSRRKKKMGSAYVSTFFDLLEGTLKVTPPTIAVTTANPPTTQAANPQVGTVEWLGAEKRYFVETMQVTVYRPSPIERGLFLSKQKRGRRAKKPKV